MQCMCGSINLTGEVPAINADAAWRRLALDHAVGCEWVESRAHQVIRAQRLDDDDSPDYPPIIVLIAE